MYSKIKKQKILDEAENRRLQEQWKLDSDCPYVGILAHAVFQHLVGEGELTPADEEVETIMSCSQKLSKIIKENKGFPKGINNYRILRIVNPNSKPFIRVSVNMTIDWDGSSEVLDDLIKNNIYQGNLVISYKVP